VFSFHVNDNCTTCNSIYSFRKWLWICFGFNYNLYE